jgi:arsenate reductase
MKNTIFYLSSCSTCTRILKELQPDNSFELQDIKTSKIRTIQLEEMAGMAGSYEALFSRRAMKFKSMGLKDKVLSETDFKKLILEEYTFLKRPVFVINSQIFIGNSTSVVNAVKSSMNK